MFKSQNFCHIASNNRNQVKAGVFVYRTTDDLATVSASGYFNDRIIDINLHDIIIHEKVNAIDNTKVEQNILCVTERTLSNIGTTVVKSKWEGDIEQAIAELQTYVDTHFVKLDGTSVMTGPLLMRATDDFKCAIAPYWDGVGFFKLNDNNSVTLMASLEYEDGLTPATDNKYNLGTSTKRWKDARIARVITATLNNGYDIAVPVTASSDTLALKSEVDLAANSGRMITAQGVWYAKMYAATVAPSAEDGTNYADFSQTDGQGNPIIVIYERQSGAWVQSETITPPAEYDGYVPITSKIWDIADQTGQQGGRVLWNHQSKEFTPYPQIISFDGANITNGSFQGSADLSGTSTVTMPNNPGSTQIVNKDYVDTAVAQSAGNVQSIDAEVIGSLTVSADGEVSGFGNNNYLIFPGNLDMTGVNSFEIGFAFKISSNTADFILNNSGDYIKFSMNNNSHLVVSIYNQADNNTQLLKTGYINWGVKNYIKLVYDGTNYTLSLAEDGYSYVIQSNVVATYLPGICTAPYLICPSSGINTAYMGDWYIKKNDILVYQGMGAPGLHQRASNRHEVIAFQAPTSVNNYTWYRKYADGWVEQGGQIAESGDNIPVVFPIEMADTNYSVVGGTLDRAGAQGWRYANRTTTGFTKNLVGSTNCGGTWEVKGMAL